MHTAWMRESTVSQWGLWRQSHKWRPGMPANGEARRQGGRRGATVSLEDRCGRGIHAYLSNWDSVPKLKGEGGVDRSGMGPAACGTRHMHANGRAEQNRAAEMSCHGSLTATCWMCLPRSKPSTVGSIPQSFSYVAASFRIEDVLVFAARQRWVRVVMRY